MYMFICIKRRTISMISLYESTTLQKKKNIFNNSSGNILKLEVITYHQFRCHGNNNLNFEFYSNLDQN